MAGRDWWAESSFIRSGFNFKWQPVSFGIRFSRLSSIGLTQVNYYLSLDC